MKVIGIGGRKQSGKSEFGKICEKHGFEVLSFALPLKKLVCEILNKTYDELNRSKELSTCYSFSNNVIKHVSDVTNIPFNTVDAFFKENEFKTIRQILQKVGTDLIRLHQPDWHVKKLEEIILSKPENSLICFDDLRFQNEKYFIENKLKGVTSFIIRPNNKKVSNHESETSLSWYDFSGNEIINDKELNTILETWEEYVTRVIESTTPQWVLPTFHKLNRESFNSIDEYMDENRLSFSMKNKFTSIFVRYIIENNVKLEWLDNGKMVFKCKDQEVLQPLKVYMGLINKIESVDGIARLELNNPYIIENLKFFHGTFYN